MEQHKNENLFGLINTYFIIGIKQFELSEFLTIRHNMDISLRKLQRILQCLNLYRRKNYTNLNIVLPFIQNE